MGRVELSYPAFRSVMELGRRRILTKMPSLVNGDEDAISDQVAEERAGFCLSCPSDSSCEDAIECARHNGPLHVQIDFQGHSRGEGVHMEEVNGLGHRVFDDHSARVPVNQGCGFGFVVVGDQQCGLMMSEVGIAICRTAPLYLFRYTLCTLTRGFRYSRPMLLSRMRHQWSSGSARISLISLFVRRAA